TSDWLAFELLNEIVLPDSAPWNRLLAKAVERIRQVDLERLIVIGGNYYNSVGELANLTFLADPNILYTFHFYEPLVVTHQKAHWARGVVEYDRNMEYPGIAPGLSEFVGQHPEFASILGRSAGVRLDRSTLHELLQPAFEFMQEHHCPLYCGEYGVIDLASMPTRLNWTRDFVSLLKEHSIGRAAWSYKAMDFGLVDRDGRPASQELIDIVCGD
ncbi:MAG TPA: cellulase family glycosylhydrolase, partial [Anaerolineales bacterium]|nr:cellulase family glycosylhydrolase [Anaerolineales bacterium]